MNEQDYEKIAELITQKIKPKKRGNMTTFSKKAVVAFIVAWFLIMAFGVWWCTVQVLRGDMSTNIGDLLVFVGAPVTGAIIGYLAKSAYEKKKLDIDEEKGA